MNNNIENKKGFALLFAVLISGLLITIGISIFNISIKELMISASIRDSQTAYYAVDSAKECFSYWDTVSDYFRYCETESCIKETESINCNGNDAVFEETVEGGLKSSQFVKYSTNPTDTLEPVASMEIIRNRDGEDLVTYLVFKGYNTGETGRRVERLYTKKIITVMN